MKRLQVIAGVELYLALKDAKDKVDLASIIADNHLQINENDEQTLNVVRNNLSHLISNIRQELAIADAIIRKHNATPTGEMIIDACNHVAICDICGGGPYDCQCDEESY